MNRFIAITFLLSLTTLCYAQTPYWIGDGGRGKSIGILIPESQGLPEEQDYIPAMVQGNLVTNISKYSAISVLDRVALDRVISETLDPTYQDNLDIVRLGHVAHVGYMMTGQVRRTSTGYNLQINITDTADGRTIASYSGTSTIADLDNLTAIQLASKELLTQMGVSLTQSAINELGAVRTQQSIGAETALARGITAQRQGTEVAALSYFFQAADLDPSLIEAATRSSVISANISSGNIGADARNDIQWRRAWVARLTETEEFFQRMFTTADPPYTLFYSTGIQQGRINYQTETLDLSIPINLRMNTAWISYIQGVVQAVQTVNDGLVATGRKNAWELSGWPDRGVTNNNPFYKNWQTDYSIVFELLNEQNRVIGRQTIRITSPYYNVDAADYSYTLIRRTYSESTSSTVHFTNVKADDISDNLTIQVASINGARPENIRFPIVALSDVKWREYTITNHWADMEFTNITQRSRRTATLQANASQFYRVTVSAANTTLTAYTESNIDTLMWLYDANWNELAHDDDSGSGYNARISSSVSAGTYYFRVAGYNNASGPYTMVLD